MVYARYFLWRCCAVVFLFSFKRFGKLFLIFFPPFLTIK
jgi:hypothetical protein